jgi:phage-related protein
MSRQLEKPIVWVGNSKKDLMALPAPVRRFFGYSLHDAQRGERHEAAKPLKGFGGSSVLEVIEDNSSGSYRAVYTIKFANAVFVLHCFQKKSKTGIGTPLREIEMIRTRLKSAEAIAKEMQNE